MESLLKTLRNRQRDEYLRDQGFISQFDDSCVVCGLSYVEGDRIAKATPKYWKPKHAGAYKRHAHLVCALRSRREDFGQPSDGAASE
jgi:hypothetical protein